MYAVWSQVVVQSMWAAQNYHIYPKYLDTLTPNILVLKFEKKRSILQPIGVSKIVLDELPSRPWSDTTLCGIWSGSLLFAQAFFPN